ncbi:MAG: glucosamine inositolphosphorylceramide transferase family protein [Acidimicrobiia bacterium]
MSSRTLSVAVMGHGTSFPAWQALALRDLLAVPGVSVPLLIVDPRRAEAADRRRRRWQDPALLWRVYNNRWVARRSAALGQVDLSNELDAATVLRARVERRGKWSEHFSDDDLATIRDHAPDIILRFAYGIIRGQILDIAPFGVWSFHHGDIERYRGGPPAFWEIDRDDHVTGAVLQRLTDRLDGGVVLQQGWFATVKHSYVRNLDRVLFGGAHWPAQMCREVLAGRTSRTAAPPTTSHAPIDHNPTTGQMVGFVGRLGRNWLKGQTRSIVLTDRWRIGVVDAPIADVAQHGAADPRWIAAGVPRCEYVADPFPDPSTGSVLAEHFSYRSRQGRLVRIDPREASPRMQPVDAPIAAHASYPFTLVADGRSLCFPQIAGDAGVQSFELTDRGLRTMRLLVPDVHAIDPTLVQHDDHWWLFFTDGDRGPMSHLHVWHARALGGPWEPHLANPVKVDVRSARPAGTPFVVGGALHRPAQDCSVTYGGGIVVNRIERLTPHEFEERPVSTLRPHGTWAGATGCHTLSSVDDRTLIDAKWAEICPVATVGELRARIGRLAVRRARS